MVDRKAAADEAATRNLADEEWWLRHTRLEELYRLARLCDIDLDQFPVDKRNLSREDLITVLQSARESEVTDARFRELIRPAITFDVKNAREDCQEQLEDTRQSLQAEIKPLKELSQRIKIWAAIVVGVAGILGAFLLNSLLGIRELETRMQNRLETATKDLDTAKANLTEAEARAMDSADKVDELETRLDVGLSKATKANDDFQKMIVALSTHTGIQIIGKLNARLDRLRSMKVYHLKPLMNELALEIESDARTLKNLEMLLKESQPGSDEHELLVSLGNLSTAIRELKLIYDEDDQIDMEKLKQARRQWPPLRDDISIVEVKLQTMMLGNWTRGSGNLPRLKANVYQVEAGLAIQQYREGGGDEHLLQKARDKCTAAIAEDQSAPMSYLYDGLISSLRISGYRDQEMDPNERIRLVERAKNRGLESYRSVARVTTTPELKIYALNGSAYLMVKTSNIYVEAAKDPDCTEYQAEYDRVAAELLASARQEIDQAEQSAATIDPIVLTTEADIEMLSLQFQDPEDPEAKYREILELLQNAVAYGYTGYSGPREVFFEKRPHFHHLAKLNDNYEDDVCRAVGIH